MAKYVHLFQALETITNGRSAMIKCMSPLSTQRAKLLEAIEIASGIARCEPDAQTVRATVMYNLERNIDDFPVSGMALPCIISLTQITGQTFQ